MLRHTVTRSSRSRPGYVLFAVLIVAVVLTLVAYQYAEAMTGQLQAAVRAHEIEQAKANAVSGVHWACSVLSDPNSIGTNFSDAADKFSAQKVGDSSGGYGGGMFSVMNVADTGDGTNTYTRRYGLSDESGKININALILLDPTGQLLHDTLMKLANMTEDIADAIVDWVDADSTTRPAGAEDDYYSGLAPAYRIKNGPLNSLEELLLIRDITPDLLYGADRNRNGVQDTNETSDGSGFTRGWSEFLTCYGRELNTDSTGVQRINLNDTDVKKCSDALTVAVGQELSDYIMYFRFSGTSTTAPATLPANQVAAPVSSLRDLVKSRVDGNFPSRRKISSVLTIVGTQIPLARAPNTPPNIPTQVVACPINDTESLKKIVQVLLDKCTVSEDLELTPSINVLTAPKEVLAALPGLADSDVTNLMSSRPAPGGTDDTAAWMLTQANLDVTKFRNIARFVTGRSGAYRVQSIGYFAQTNGPTARCEAVIEYVVSTDANNVTQGRPRIVYFRELNELGRGFNDLPR